MITSSSFADMIDKTVLKTVTTPANNENDSSETQEQPKKGGKQANESSLPKTKEKKFNQIKKNAEEIFCNRKKKGTKKGTKKTMFVKRN